MSLFQEDTSEIEQSISYFNSLDRKERAIIVSDFGYVTKNKELFNKLKPLFSAVQTDIAKHDEDTIANQLYKLKMDEEFAKLLVGSMIKQAPTLEYQVSLIAKMKDEEFNKFFPDFMVDAWVNKKTDDEIIKKYGITTRQLASFVMFSRDMMNGFCRTTFSEEKIIQLCKDHDLSDAKLEILLNTMKIHTEFWKSMLVFSNTQDAVLELRTIKQQNNAILDTLKDILKLIKESRGPTDTRHFQ